MKASTLALMLVGVLWVSTSSAPVLAQDVVLASAAPQDDPPATTEPLSKWPSAFAVGGAVFAVSLASSAALTTVVGATSMPLVWPAMSLGVLLLPGLAAPLGALLTFAVVCVPAVVTAGLLDDKQAAIGVMWGAAGGAIVGSVVAIPLAVMTTTVSSLLWPNLGPVRADQYPPFALGGVTFMVTTGVGSAIGAGLGAAVANVFTSDDE